MGTRVIFYVDKLLQLAEGRCLEQGCGQLYFVKQVHDGCGLALIRICPNGHNSVWESSEVILNQKNRKLHITNLCLADIVWK